MDWPKRKEKIRLQLCDLLVKTGALKFGEFVLTSGRLSPYYIDLRLLPSFPPAFKMACDFYIDLIRNEVGIDEFDRMASVPVAGLPFASVVAYDTKKPLLLVRKAEKTHGRERRIEGIIMPADRILLIDDLITTGKSLVETVEAIRAEGGTVRDAVVLIDREEGGRESLNKIGVKVHSIAKMSEIARLLRGRSLLPEDKYRAVLKQIRISKAKSGS